MKQLLEKALIFCCGCAVGGYAAFTYCRRKAQEEVRRQTADMQAYYKEKERKLDEKIQQCATEKAYEMVTGPYRMEEDPESRAQKSLEAIELIGPDEFGGEDYETSFLTLFADGILVEDAGGFVVQEEMIPEMIGEEALKHIGEFAPGMIHVRNHERQMDYEISEVRQCYLNIENEEAEEE